MKMNLLFLVWICMAFCAFNGALCRSMGVMEKCDDGKTNLTIDWDESPNDYACHLKIGKILGTNQKSDPILECERLPPNYAPLHICMDRRINYATPMPTHGDHRPVWPQYGEYKFVPVQRWSHNVEHGAIVMLYHPCTKPALVTRLKNLVTGCIRKHIITASTFVPETTPLVLIAWGCRLRMNSVHDKFVKEFIKERAMRGPEGRYTKDGEYDLGLIKPAEAVPGSNFDSNLCPE